jgi:2-O-methyltransferase
LTKIFENPNIYCFEPDPRAIDRFKEKVGENPNVKLFEIALSDKNGSICFYQSSGVYENYATEMPEGWDLSGSIRQPKNHLKVYPTVKFSQSITVDTKTLDT